MTRRELMREAAEIAAYYGNTTVPVIPEHYCFEHLEHRNVYHVETHGLDCGPYERWHEEWDECRVCGEVIEASDWEARNERSN
jgi:hypothetical protein